MSISLTHSYSLSLSLSLSDTRSIKLTWHSLSLSLFLSHTHPTLAFSHFEVLFAHKKVFHTQSWYKILFPSSVPFNNLNVQWLVLNKLILDFTMIFLQKRFFNLISWGRGDGLVVSVLAFDSGYPNSNPVLFWKIHFRLHQCLTLLDFCYLSVFPCKNF